MKICEDNHGYIDQASESEYGLGHWNDIVIT